MNLLTIIILLLLLVFAIDGYRKGLVRTLTALMFFVVSGILVYQATPYISEFIKNKTPVYQMIETPCEKMIEEAIHSVTEGKGKTESGQVPRNDQSKIIKALPLPQKLQTQLLDHNNSYTYENLAVKTFSEYLSRYLTDMFLNMFIYLTVFSLANILLRVAAEVLNQIVRLPVLSTANRTAGLCLGLVKGIGIVWIFFVAVTLFIQTEFGGQLMEMIKESTVLTVLYDADFFLKYLTGIVG